MPRTDRATAVPRRAKAYFALAFVAVLVTLLLWHSQVREIDLNAATRRADRLLAVYIRDSGEPPAHFIPGATIGYADGWEFAWRYRPCPDVAALKVFIGKSGSAAYSAIPDCTPRRDYAVGPRYL